MNSSRKKTPKVHSSTVDQPQKELKISKKEKNEPKLDQHVTEVKLTGQKLERLSLRDKIAKPKPSHPIAGNLGQYTRREKVEQKRELLNDKESIFSKSSKVSSSENGHVKIMPKKSISENKSCVDKPTLKQRSCKDERAPNQPEILSGKVKSHPTSYLHSTGNPAKKPIISSTDHKNSKRKLLQTISKTPTDVLISNDEKLKPSLKQANLVTPAKQSNLTLEKDTLKSKTSKTGSKKTESVLEQTKLAFKRIKAALKPNKPSSVPSKSELNQTKSQIEQNKLELIKTRSESDLRRIESAQEQIIPLSNQIESALEHNESVTEAVKGEPELPQKLSELAIKPTISVLKLSKLVFKQTESTLELNKPPVDQIEPTSKQNELTTEKTIKYSLEPLENIKDKTNLAPESIRQEKLKIEETESAKEKLYLFLEQTKLASEVSTSSYELSELALKEAKLVKEQALLPQEHIELLVEQNQPERGKTESRLAPKSSILKSSKSALEETALKSELKPVGKIPIQQIEQELKETDTVNESIKPNFKVPKLTVELNEIALKHITSLSESTKFELEKTELAAKETLKPSEPTESSLKLAKSPLEQIELKLANIVTKEPNNLQNKSASEPTKLKNEINKSVSASEHMISSELALEKNIPALKLIEILLKKAESQFKENITSNEQINPIPFEKAIPLQEPSESTLIPNLPSQEKSEKETDWAKGYTKTEQQLAVKVTTTVKQDKSDSEINKLVQPSESAFKKTKLGLQPTVPEIKSTKSPIEQEESELKEKDTAIEQINSILQQVNPILQQKQPLIKELAIMSGPKIKEQKNTESPTNVLLKSRESAFDKTKSAMEPTKSALKPLVNTESEVKENERAKGLNKSIFEQNELALKQILYVLGSTKPKQGVNELASVSSNAILKSSESVLEKIISALSQTEMSKEHIDTEKENIRAREQLDLILKQVIRKFEQSKSAQKQITSVPSDSVATRAQPASKLSESTLIPNMSPEETELQVAENDIIREITNLILRQGKIKLEQKLSELKQKIYVEQTNIKYTKSETHAILKSSASISESALEQTETMLQPLKKVKPEIKEKSTVKAPTNSILNDVKPAIRHNESEFNQIKSTSDSTNQQQQKTELTLIEIIKLDELELQLTKCPQGQTKSESEENCTTKEPPKSVLMENKQTSQETKSITKRIESVPEVTTPEEEINYSALTPANVIIKSSMLTLEKTTSALQQKEMSQELADSEKENIIAREPLHPILKQVIPKLEQIKPAEKQITTITEPIEPEKGKTVLVANKILKPNLSALNQTKLAYESNVSQSNLITSPLEQTKSESKEDDMAKVQLTSIVNQVRPKLEKEQSAIKQVPSVSDPIKPVQEKIKLPLEINKLKSPVAPTNLILQTSQSALEQAILSLGLNDWILQPPEFESEQTNLTFLQTESAREETFQSLEQTETVLEKNRTVSEVTESELKQTKSSLGKTKLALDIHKSTPEPITQMPTQEFESAVNPQLVPDELKSGQSIPKLYQYETVLEQTSPELKQIEPPSELIKPVFHIPLFQQIERMLDQTYPELEKDEINFKKTKSNIKQTQPKISLTSQLEETDTELKSDLKLGHNETTLKQSNIGSLQNKMALDILDAALEQTNTLHHNLTEKEKTELAIKQSESELEQLKAVLHLNGPESEPIKPTLEQAVLEENQKLEKPTSQIELLTKLALVSNEPRLKQKEITYEKNDPTLGQTKFTKIKSTLGLAQPKPELEEVNDPKLTLELTEIEQTNPQHQNVVEKEKTKLALKQSQSEFALSKWALKLTESVLEQPNKEFIQNEPALKQTEIQSEQPKELEPINPNLEQTVLEINQKFEKLTSQIELFPKVALESNEPTFEQKETIYDPTLERTFTKIKSTSGLAQPEPRLEAVKHPKLTLQLTELEQTNPLHKNLVEKEKSELAFKQTESELELSKRAIEPTELVLEQPKNELKQNELALQQNFEQSKSQLEQLTNLALASNESKFEQKEAKCLKTDPTFEQTIFTKTKSTLELVQPETGLEAINYPKYPLELTESVSVLRETELLPDLPSSITEITKSELKLLKHIESDKQEEKITMKQTTLLLEQIGTSLDKTESATEQIEPESEQTDSIIEKIGYADDPKLPLKQIQASFGQNKMTSTCFLTLFDTAEEFDLEETKLATRQTVLVSDQTRTEFDKTKLASEQIESELEQTNQKKGRIGSKADIKLALKLTPTRLKQIKVASACFLPLHDTLEPGLEQKRITLEETEILLDQINPEVKQTVSKLNLKKLALDLIDSALERIKMATAEYAPSTEIHKTALKWNEMEEEMVKRETEQNQSALKSVIDQNRQPTEKTKPALEQMNPVLMLVHVVPNPPRSEKTEQVEKQMEPALEQRKTESLLVTAKLALELIESELNQTRPTQEQNDAALLKMNMEFEETVQASEIIEKTVTQTMPTQRNTDLKLKQTKLAKDQPLAELDQIQSELQQIESELRLMKLALLLPEHSKELKHSPPAFKNMEPNLEQIEFKITSLEQTKSSVLHLNTLAWPIADIELKTTKDVNEYTSHELKHFKQEVEQEKSILGRTESSLEPTKLAMEQIEPVLKETKYPLEQALLDINNTKSSSQQYLEQELTKQASKQTNLATGRTEMELKQPNIELNYETVLIPTVKALEQPQQVLEEIKSTIKFKELLQKTSKPKIELTKSTIEELKFVLEQIIPESKQTESAFVQTKTGSASIKLQLGKTKLAYSQTEVRDRKSTLEEYKSMLQILKTIGLEECHPLVSTEFLTEKQENIPFLLNNVTSNDKLTELITEQQFKLQPEKIYTVSEQSEPIEPSLNTSITYTKQPDINDERIEKVLEQTSKISKDFTSQNKNGQQRKISTDQLNFKKEEPKPEFNGFEEDISKQITESLCNGDEQIKVESEQRLSVWEITSSLGEIIKPLLILEHPKNKESPKTQEIAETITEYFSNEKEQINATFNSTKLILNKEQDENNQAQSQAKHSDLDKEATNNLVAEQKSKHFTKPEQNHICPKQMFSELLEKLSVHQFHRPSWVSAEPDEEISDHSSEKEELPGQISVYDNSKLDGGQKTPKYYDQIAKYLSTQVVKSLVSKTESESQGSEQSYNIMQKTSSSAAVSLNIVQSIKSNLKQDTANQNIKEQKTVDEPKKNITPVSKLPCLTQDRKIKQMSDFICGRDNKDSQFVSCTRSLKEDIYRKKYREFKERRTFVLYKEQLEKMRHQPEQPVHKMISEYRMSCGCKQPSCTNRSTSMDKIWDSDHKIKSKVMRNIWRGIRLIYKACKNRSYDYEISLPFGASVSVLRLGNRGLHHSESKACMAKLDCVNPNRENKSDLQYTRHRPSLVGRKSCSCLVPGMVIAEAKRTRRKSQKHCVVAGDSGTNMNLQRRHIVFEIFHESVLLPLSPFQELNNCMLFFLPTKAYV